MTSLTKQVKRLSSATVRERGAARPIVIILTPPNVLTFRAKGCRKGYDLTAEACYIMAVRADYERKRKDKLNKKKARKVNRGLLK
jgi:hypothetical protein